MKGPRRGPGPVANKPDSNTVRACVEAVLRHCPSERDEVAVRFVDADEMREINRTYRGKDAPTNVLSFVFEDPPGAESSILGDILVCPQVVHEEAQAQSKRSDAHFSHMIVHGALHLCGYDHENEQDAAAMEALEVEILSALGFGDPY